ncbi:PREDICTED: uncharacterized protein LOC109114950 [Nelumbo nucifera]|uniref:Uncharacterized protein LOC109114950 n=1 Tax=Nelumbo nucifera TaxID=4432 RepID=A0A1U8Q7C7_NELNU|nr:PREDICTED: uncharacterized protein LOC109114950 [Nelumbo nucifera]
MCGEEEDTYHLFINCPFAKQVWNIAKDSLRIPNDFNDNICDWWNHILSNNGMDPSGSYRKEKFVLLLQLWKNHKECVFKNRSLPPSIIIERAYNTFLEIHEVNDENQSSLRKKEVIPVRWNSPNFEAIKINFDASCISGDCSVACVARDHLDHILDFKAYKLGKTTINIAKVWAAWEAHNLSLNFPNKFIIIKGDSKLVIDSLKRISSPRGECVKLLKSASL